MFDEKNAKTTPGIVFELVFVIDYCGFDKKGFWWLAGTPTCLGFLKSMD